MYIILQSVYRKFSAMVRPVQSTHKGRACLLIKASQLHDAERRCAYAGADGIDRNSLPQIAGYGPWIGDWDDNWRAYKV